MLLIYDESKTPGNCKTFETFHQLPNAFNLYADGIADGLELFIASNLGVLEILLENAMQKNGQQSLDLDVSIRQFVL